MKIWIFIAIINLNGYEIRTAPESIKYAFVRKEACEYAIAESKNLKYIELELLQ